MSDVPTQSISTCTGLHTNKKLEHVHAETTSLLLHTSVNTHAHKKLRLESCLETLSVGARSPLQQMSNGIPLLLWARSLLLPAQIHCVLTHSASHHLCTSQTASLRPAQPAQEEVLYFSDNPSNAHADCFTHFLHFFSFHTPNHPTNTN